MRAHDFCIQMDWCRRCGRTRIEIVDADLAECDGLEGVIHKRYTDARHAMEKMFDPIVDRIAKDLELR